MSPDSPVGFGRPGGSGGGIYCRGAGELHLISSTVSGNHAGDGGFGGVSGSPGGYGGGIFSEETLYVTNSTISGNFAGNGGASGGDPAGGNGGSGGGIAGYGTFFIEHSTISENTAGSGAETGPDGDGGGISHFHSTNPLTLINSIVTNNTASNNADIAGTIDVSMGVNLTSGDPRLAPLGDYGGHTRTMPPLPGSPAIESGVLLAGTPSLDQRDAARLSGELPDIGAVEAFAFSTLPLVDTDLDGIDDRIETGIFGSLTTATATSDFDGDRHTDRDEISNMTDPRDGQSLFQITDFKCAADFDPLTNPAYRVTVQTFPGLTYELEGNTSPDSFAPIGGSAFTATGFSETSEIILTEAEYFVRAIRK